ncbi:hypothetical protein AB0G02_24515 [Actinosynnema sp. NPDC023658]|uniref:hypothetical protein n=1 Tax=Actinosynnema sp. NPDC023658 TaxID=3155465 RepID=UPI00340F0B2F
MTAVLAGGRRSRTDGDGREFHFWDVNPLTGVALCASRFDDLPEFIALVVGQMGFSAAQWDRLVRAGGVVEEVDCHRARVIPWTLNRPLSSPPVGKAPEGTCVECWGTCVEIDTDGSLTGVVGASLVCICTRLSARGSR